MPYNTWGLNEILFQAFQTHLRNQPPGALKGNKMTRKNSLLPLPATQPVLCLTWEIKYCVWGPPELGNLLGMLHVGNRYYYYLCLSTCTFICHLSVYLPTYLSIRLSVYICFVSELQLPDFRSQFSQAIHHLPLTSFLVHSLAHGCLSTWLLASLSGTFSAGHRLSPHRQLFHPGQKLTPGSQNSFALFIPDKVPVTENGLSSRFQYMFSCHSSHICN